MTVCSITVASYAMVEEAMPDWASLEAAAAAEVPVMVDAALVEADSGTVRRFHRQLRSCPARGALAGAVIGLLQPPSMVVGAVAGGVGGHVIVALDQGLSRDQVKALGEAMDAGPVAIVVVAASSPSLDSCGLLAGAIDSATAAPMASAEDLRLALRADQADD